MAHELLVVLGLILLNGVFSGAEIAIVAARRTRLETLAEAGSGRAKAVLRLRDAPAKMFATVQVGVTVLTASAATLGGTSIAGLVAAHLAKVSWLAPYAPQLAATLVVAGISYLAIVLGELVPKSLALRHAEGFALTVGGLLLVLSKLATPLVWLLTASANLVLRPFGDRTSFTEALHSGEELQRLVERAARAGTVDAQAGEIAARALELPELATAEVMIPWQNVTTLRRDASADEARRLGLAHPSWPLPVVDRAGKVVGHVSAVNVIGRTSADLIGAALEAPHFVPESKRAIELLHEMRRGHVHVVFVVDELGAVVGMVTLEDLLEELLGDVFVDQIQHLPQFIRRQGDGSVLASGTAPVRDVNRVTGLALPEAEGWSTVAGLCLSLAGHVPEVGEVLRTPRGLTLEVVDASPQQVRAVRVRPPER